MAGRVASGVAGPMGCSAVHVKWLLVAGRVASGVAGLCTYGLQCCACKVATCGRKGCSVVHVRWLLVAGRVASGVAGLCTYGLQCCACKVAGRVAGLCMYICRKGGTAYYKSVMTDFILHGIACVIEVQGRLATLHDNSGKF